jgi:anti-sigma B factor antagonist
MQPGRGKQAFAPPGGPQGKEPATAMELSVRETNGIQVVTVTGRVTIGAASEKLNEELERLALRGGKIVLLLDDVPQIDSSGMAAIVRNSISLVRDGGALRLVCGPGRVRDALTVTRLVEAIPTFETEAAALANFS